MSTKTIHICDRCKVKECSQPAIELCVGSYQLSPFASPSELTNQWARVDICDTCCMELLRDMLALMNDNGREAFVCNVRNYIEEVRINDDLAKGYLP